MQTSIQQVNPTEYELEIKASADDLAPEIDKALRAQRTRTSLKGFRPGKVPLSMVKKLYGKALAFGVAEQSIQDTYDSTVLKSDEYEVLGQPTISKFDYDPFGDLVAVVRFGVRPEFEIKDLSSEQVTRLVHEVTDEEVDKELERLREREADLIPVEGGVEEDSYVVLDIQRLDDETGSPIIGEKEEDVSFFMTDEYLKETLHDALIGKTAGETFRVDLPHEHDHEHEYQPQSELLELPTPPEEHQHEHHTHAYQVTLKEIKRRELPELDAEFIQEVSEGEYEDVDAFRQNVREVLENSWKRHSRDFTSERITEKMLELHPIPVPESVVESFLDSFVEDVKQRNEGNMPSNFDENAFRSANRDEAERQARWMLIRDKLIETEDVEVTDEDREKYFEESASGQLDANSLRQFYQSVPSLMNQLDEQLRSNKVFEMLTERFDVVDKTTDEIEEEMKARASEEVKEDAAEEIAPADVASEENSTVEPAAEEEPPAAEGTTGETQELPEKEQ